MIDLQAIVAFNSAAILLMAIVLINSHTSFRLNPLDNKLFRLMVVFTMLQTSIQTLSYFIHGVSFPGGGILVQCYHQCHALY